jgi:hypothetical protein
MPEEQDNQIERSQSGDISRISETARRGMNAANYIAGLTNRGEESGLPNTVPTDSTYEFWLKWGTNGTGDGEFGYPVGVAVASDGSVYVVEVNNARVQKFSVGP